jgi:ribosome maturation factor RimP
MRASVDTPFEPFLTPHEGPAEALRAVIEPALSTLGLELVQLFFVRGAHKDTVRVFADRPQAPGRARISMAEIERASRLLSDVLDVEDQERRLFPHAYDLEVGSPGVDRPLTKRSHFAGARGERIKLKTRVPYANARSLAGTLVDAQDEAVLVRLDGQGADEEPLAVRFDDVQSAHTIFVFETPQKPRPGKRPRPPKERSQQQKGAR